MAVYSLLILRCDFQILQSNTVDQTETQQLLFPLCMFDTHTSMEPREGSA